MVAPIPSTPAGVAPRETGVGIVHGAHDLSGDQNNQYARQDSNL